ncbi:MAG: lysoplasmalogenase [Theionarchaea archaeon]|nr:lysoplasmalogenase [Theionarchaea archaeon]
MNLDTRMQIFTKFLVFVSLAAVVIFFVGVSKDSFVLRMISKPLPVLCIAVWVYRGKKGRYNAFICGGLLLSVLGDIFLEWGDHTFLAGVLAFLFAQVLYIGAFINRSRDIKPLYALPFAVWGCIIYALLFGNLDGMAIPVGLYIVIICIMMWRATAQVGTGDASRGDTLAGAAGAVSFGLSDSLLALNRWYMPMPEARYLIITLYWLGQLGIGLSTRLQKRSD